MKKLSIAQNYLFNLLFLNLTPDKFLSDEDRFVIKNTNLPTFEKKWKKIYLQLKENKLINITDSKPDVPCIFLNDSNLFLSLSKNGLDRGINLINNSPNYDKIFKKGGIANLLAALSFAGAELNRRIEKEGFTLNQDANCFDQLVLLQQDLTKLLIPYFTTEEEVVEEEVIVEEEVKPTKRSRKVTA